MVFDWQPDTPSDTTQLALLERLVPGGLKVKTASAPVPTSPGSLWARHTPCTSHTACVAGPIHPSPSHTHTHGQAQLPTASGSDSTETHPVRVTGPTPHHSTVYVAAGTLLLTNHTPNANTEYT